MKESLHDSKYVSTRDPGSVGEILEARCISQRDKRHPLGPLLRFERFITPTPARLLSGVVCIAAIALLSVAAWLSPDPAGHGTHQQLGFQSCTMMAVSGIPCPTCGMTTSFAHAIRGQWFHAFSVQPMGAILAAATMLTALGAGLSAATGRAWRLNWYRVPLHRVVMGAVALSIAAWGYKIWMLTRVQGS